ncbi:hypothetical protein GCM10011507_05140 [Edaphobacter acidisoli]|uniref:Uncharacterized protein n=1 Tax=Edaphobacter acidisoli TaxID=2040573 RepID=A0A916RI22_9BACT|nr:hypothetical protein GCM10011507_05140 [Edaphobacter acidisoli]
MNVPGNGCGGEDQGAEGDDGDDEEDVHEAYSGYQGAAVCAVEGFSGCGRYEVGSRSAFVGFPLDRGALGISTESG